MAPDETLRGKTDRLKRQHILAAAIQVFSERGFQRTTIRDIGKRAGVADGTIYNVFENKASLLMALIEPLEGDSGAEPLPVEIPSDPNAFMRHLIAGRWSSFTPETLGMLRVVLSEALVDPDLRRLFYDRVIAPVLTRPEPLVGQLVEAGTLASRDIPLTLRIMTASLLGLVVLRLLGDERLERDAAAVPAALAHMLLDGLRPRFSKEDEGDAI